MMKYDCNSYNVQVEFPHFLLHRVSFDSWLMGAKIYLMARPPLYFPVLFYHQVITFVRFGHQDPEDSR